jgi:hypothetical protein
METYAKDRGNSNRAERQLAQRAAVKSEKVDQMLTIATTPVLPVSPITEHETTRLPWLTRTGAVGASCFGLQELFRALIMPSKDA